MRKLLAVWVAKLAILLGKLGGKKGSSSPGGIALKICPDLLSRLSSGIKKEVIVVCGTNGKTTTNNMICAALEQGGNKVVCNRIGANMLEGVTTAFIARSNFFGRVRADYAAIEVDEISAVKVFRQLKPDYVVITNFFRDQLDRYGEIDITMQKLKEAIDLVPDVKLVLNADDPLTVEFGKCGRESHYFGVGEQVLKHRMHEIKEGRFCRGCGAELTYEYYHYSQLGSYHCEQCSFTRPTPEFEAQGVNLRDGIEFDVQDERIKFSCRGFYNIYNVLAGFAITRLLGLGSEFLHKALADYKPQVGRMEQFNIQGKPIIFNLSKNPAGFNQAISTLLEDDRKKAVAFALNDNAQDGKDISWIWDVDFEALLDDAGNFIAAGLRRHEIMVRLKYAEFDMSRASMAQSLEVAMREAIKSDAGVVYVLVNYTALFSTQDILKKMEKSGL